MQVEEEIVKCNREGYCLYKEEGICTADFGHYNCPDRGTMQYRGIGEADG